MLNPPQRERCCISLVSQGAFVGLFAGFAVSLWVGIGAQLYPPLPERTLPLSLEVHGCNITHNGSDWISTTEMPFSTSAFQIHNVERYELLSSRSVFPLPVPSRGLQVFRFYFFFCLMYNTAFCPNPEMGIPPRLAYSYSRKDSTWRSWRLRETSCGCLGRVLSFLDWVSILLTS